MESGWFFFCVFFPYSTLSLSNTRTSGQTGPCKRPGHKKSQKAKKAPKPKPKKIPRWQQQLQQQQQAAQPALSIIANIIFFVFHFKYLKSPSEAFFVWLLLGARNIEIACMPFCRVNLKSGIFVLYGISSMCALWYSIITFPIKTVGKYNVGIFISQ